MWEGLFRADGGRRRTPLSDRLRNGCFLSREVRIFRTSSEASQLGHRLRNAILASDAEEASALIALEAANLLAGIHDEAFRLKVRQRVAERLVRMPTIGAA
ncbi:hypothetical protein [Azoarcus taiwanensis]|uniref:hypothetical protein n=1 Tax=Azoarcus taiwanensis TaxID=666964 RepID=UPI001FE78E75|nr:hypothetical protein [Azoarcus taiwanensis]